MDDNVWLLLVLLWLRFHEQQQQQQQNSPFNYRQMLLLFARASKSDDDDRFIRISRFCSMIWKTGRVVSLSALGCAAVGWSLLVCGGALERLYRAREQRTTPKVIILPYSEQLLDIS